MFRVGRARAGAWALLGALGALAWLQEAFWCARPLPGAWVARPSSLGWRTPAHERLAQGGRLRRRVRLAACVAEPPAPTTAERCVSDVNLAVINAARLPEPGASCPEFSAHKACVLERTLRHDKSPKGSVDVRVVDILAELNRRDEYVTTSSCSGRVFFMAYGEGVGSDSGSGERLVLPDIKTKVGRWRRVSHDGIEDAEAYFDLDTEPLNEARDHLWLKVQPFSVDVACASAAAAHRLVAVAREVYQRGASTISPSCEWKTVVSIEGHERLEMPFTICGQRVYSGSLEALASIVNGKLEKNWGRMNRLLEALKRNL